MGHVLCISSQKGGVGKTTTAVNLAAAYAIAEKRTLLVDSDPQGNSTTGIGINKRKITKSLYHGLLEEAKPDEIVLNTDIDLLKIIPAQTNLFLAEAKLNIKPGKEYALQNLLTELKHDYDYIIIDCPPSVGLLTLNGIVAADSTLIPLQCEFYALEGLGQFLKLFQAFKSQFKLNTTIEGILLTMHASEEVVSQQIAKDVQNHFKHLVFNTIIPRSKYLRESARFKKSILFRDIKSNIAQCYLELAKEIMEHH